MARRSEPRSNVPRAPAQEPRCAALSPSLPADYRRGPPRVNPATRRAAEKRWWGRQPEMKGPLAARSTKQHQTRTMALYQTRFDQPVGFSSASHRVSHHYCHPAVVAAAGRVTRGAPPAPPLPHHWGVGLFQPNRSPSPSLPPQRWFVFKLSMQRPSLLSLSRPLPRNSRR